MLSKILMPTDGSEIAQKAAKYGVDLAKQLNASVIIMSVIDHRFFVSRAVPAELTAMDMIEPIGDYLQEAAEKYTKDIVKLCEEKSVQSTVVIKTGHPVEEIIEEAEKSNAGLIVMGSHGQSALLAALLGSVTYGVLHKQTKIPVLLVKR
ncbi:MAG: universal stress protein [Proteobacteria bacterium]|nr:universal stress protein [Pseudomonadota bacterium]